MYEKFREFDIPFPKTTIIKTFDAESSILKKLMSIIFQYS